jgi:hypothetical protein
MGSGRNTFRVGFLGFAAAVWRSAEEKSYDMGKSGTDRYANFASSAVAAAAAAAAATTLPEINIITNFSISISQTILLPSSLIQVEIARFSV